MTALLFIVAPSSAIRTACCTPDLRRSVGSLVASAFGTKHPVKAASIVHYRDHDAVVLHMLGKGPFDDGSSDFVGWPPPSTHQCVTLASQYCRYCSVIGVLICPGWVLIRRTHLHDDQSSVCCGFIEREMFLELSQLLAKYSYPT
jgi:hypothetical protein